MAETLIPEVDDGEITGWTGKKDAHRGETVRHDANTCFLVRGDLEVLLARRSSGEREDVSGKRIGGGQWEGVSTHLHRRDVERYGVDPEDLHGVNRRMIELHTVSVVERIERELDVELVPGLEKKIEENSLKGIIDEIRSVVDVSHLGSFTYSMDREKDGEWSEDELCRVFTLRADPEPSMTEEVMNLRWEDAGELDTEEMRSPEYADWAAEAFKKLEKNPEQVRR